MNIKPKLILILIIALLVVNMYQISKISNLENQISNQQHQFNNLNHSINNINSSIYNTMENIKKENMWIRDIEYEIKDVSEDHEEMTVYVSWKFNELNKDEKVYLAIDAISIPEKDNMNIEKVLVKPRPDLMYSKELTLPVKAKYEIEVVGEGENTRRAGKLTTIDLYSNLRERIQLNGNLWENSSNKENPYYLNIHLFNPNMGAELFNNGRPMKEMPNELRLKSAIIEVYSNEELIKEVDLFKEATNRFPQDNQREPEEMFDYEIILEGEDFEVDDIKVIAKITDNLGLEYEKEVELNR